MEKGQNDLAKDANKILDLHRGKERILFKKLVHQFGGVLKYYTGVKKKRAKKSETKSSAKSSKPRKPNASKSKSSLSKAKAKAKASRAAVVPHANRRATTSKK